MRRGHGWLRGGSVRSADGTEITYLVRGEGPVLVAVHGGLGTALSLMPLADHLTDRFTVALVNLRGHGTSQRGLSPPHIDRYTEDVGAVIDTLGPIDALFGYSFGAVVALEAALSAPDLVPRLALYEPPLPITYPIPDLEWIRAMLDAGRYEELVLDALGRGAAGSHRPKLLPHGTIRCGCATWRTPPRCCPPWRFCRDCPLMCAATPTCTHPPPWCRAPPARRFCTRPSTCSRLCFLTPRGCS